MFFFVAPRARRTPISRVRSMTDTSMMFMITIPPTTSEMPEMKIIRAKPPAEMFFHTCWTAAALTVPNGSSPTFVTTALRIGGRLALVGNVTASRLDVNPGYLILREVSIQSKALYAPVVSRFRTYSIPVSGAAKAYCDAIWAWPPLQAWVADAQRETLRAKFHED